jgi:pimeloyl-ACP methyl ester carboxylesterase
MFMRHPRLAGDEACMPRRRTKYLKLSLLTLMSASAVHADAGPRGISAPVAREADAQGAVTIEQVRLNSLVFDVRTAGPVDGDVVILLHGFPQTSFAWRHQIPALARAGYHVIAPDLRGYSPGARPSEVSAYDLLNLVDDLLKLADHYQARRFHVVGHDVGGLVAWGTAQLAGTRLKSLTALSVPHPGAFAAQFTDPASCQNQASAWYHEAVKPGSGARALAGDPPLLLEAWASMDPAAAAEYRKVLGTPEAMDAAFNMWRANFVDGKPQGAFPIPVLVPTVYVRGERDPFNCGDGEPLTRKLSWGGYRFASLPGVGHWIPEEATEQFNDILLSHLGRNQR